MLHYIGSHGHDILCDIGHHAILIYIILYYVALYYYMILGIMLHDYILLYHGMLHYIGSHGIDILYDVGHHALYWGP